MGENDHLRVQVKQQISCKIIPPITVRSQKSSLGLSGEWIYKNSASGYLFETNLDRGSVYGFNLLSISISIFTTGVYY